MPKFAFITPLLGLLKKQKWIVPVLGLLSLMILVWFLGPHLGWGHFRPLRTRVNRLLVILLIVAVWLGVAWLRQMRAAKANQELVNGLEEDATTARAEEESKEEVARLRERFQEALQVFKKSHFKNRSGKQYLYELPWYIIIGPPGAGKTTALVNSGLEFPLEARVGREPIRGLGGTRNCEWWFTNDAVLVDTAGRYTTQDAQKAVDSAAWLAFLKLLRKNRPRCPINGVIVAVSVADLMLSSEAEREAHVEAVRARVQELYQHLGVNAPIYVMFTKADLVAGFQEFFDDLGKDPRGQVWGTTFSPEAASAAGGAVSRFAAEFDQLLERVGERMLGRVHQERDLTRRALISAFPQQLANLKEPLDTFLRKAFAPSRYEAAPLVRGVYLTSGTQEGTPIDRLMSTLAETFGLDRQALASQRDTGRSYFITRLFTDVMFPEAGLAGVNVGFERQSLWLRRAAYAGIGLAAAAIVFAWSTSFTRNQLFIHRIDSRIDQYEAAARGLGPNPSVARALPALDAARDLSQVYAGDAAPGWSLGMGLYQGYRLDSSADAAYGRVARRYLMPQVKTQLEDRIRTGLDEPEELQKVVALYLMLANPDTLNRELFRQWAATDWERSQSDPETRKDLAGHLNAALGKGLTPMTADAALVARATQVVCRIPLDRVVYGRLEQAAAASDLPGFDLGSLGGPGRALLVSASGGKADLPALYTRDGYAKLVKGRGMELTEATIAQNRKICQDNYAFAHADPDDALRKVRARYFAEYTAHWDAFLADVGLVNLGSMDDAVKAVDTLGGPDSPLRTLAKAAADQTTLEAVDLQAATGGTPSDPVAQHFQALKKAVAGEGKNPPDLDGVVTDLGELKAYLAGISGAVDARRAGFEAAKARMGSVQQDVIGRLRHTAQRLPPPLTQLVDSAAVQSWGTVLAQARAHVNDVWRASVLEPYRRTLENRYPLFASSDREATLTDFGGFFGAGGTLDSFFSAYLDPFVDTRRWQAKVVDNRGLGLSDGAIRQLKRGWEIRNTVFQDGGQRPMMRFALKPISLDAEVRQFQLDMDGQTLTYRHGPARATRVTWPGPDEDGPARIIFEQLNGGRLSVTKDGPWSWFRLLDQADVKATGSPDRLQVVFRTGGLKSAYELQAGSASNPFRSGELGRFRCPEQL